MRYTLHTTYRKLLADTMTPVSVYLRLRDQYPNSLLLESSDYHANDNSFSYICLNPVATVSLSEGVLSETYPDGKKESSVISSNEQLLERLKEFCGSFEAENSGFKFINNGLFGFMSYDAVGYFESLELNKKEGLIGLPDLHYSVYQNIIAINHFNNEAYLFDHRYSGESRLDEIERHLRSRELATFGFQRSDSVSSNITEDQFKELVVKCKAHCARGDVFQIVPSMRFTQPFTGDEFNVYRALRSINPSPYLFYFDYGNFKIFGSSPEAQLVVEKGVAEIHPIAGTFRRTGNDEQDAELARELAEDPKENSEHVMLVDLARNDLSRHGDHVKVERYKEVQFFSHVIHLVSKVTARINEGTHTLEVVADTFPAGTLSGAPKHKAMQLLENYENRSREFYGGAIGFMDFEGNFNHAIIIRSFVSRDNALHYQAGAGIVFDSDPEKELQEVYNKLGALNRALDLAETMEA